MNLLALSVPGLPNSLCPRWNVVGAETAEQALGLLQSGTVDALICPLSAKAEIADKAPWIQFGGTAEEALAHNARAWVREPLSLVELRLALRAFEDDLNLKSVLHEVDDSFVVLDSEWRYIYLNKAAMAHSSMKKTDLIGRSVWDVFPEVRGTDMEEKLRQAMATRRPMQFRRPSEFRNRVFDHHLYPVPQGLAVITSDVTDLQKAEEAARENKERLQHLTELSPNMIWTTDENGVVDYLNQHWTEYSGLPKEGLTTDERRVIVHPEDLPRAIEARNEATRLGRGYELELRLRRKDGSYRWHLSRCVPVTAGKSFYWLGTSTDIEELKRAQHALTFLADASRLLASSLDYRETLSRITQLAVPELSDWMTVDLLEDGELKQLAVAHTDHSKLVLAEELHRRYPRDPNSPRGSGAVVRSGESELMEEIPDELLEQAAQDTDHLELLRSLGLRSYICVPLKARDRTLGALTLVSAETRRTFNQHDLALAEELAARAALAIDNALLYGRTQDELAERARQEESLRNAQVELERARDEAVQASRMKSVFLANMSHEVRTPMNGIRGMVEFLEEFELLPRQAQYVATIRQCADSLLSILDDILDLSRIEAGKLEIKNSVFALPAVVRHSYTMFRHMAEEKGLEYELSTHDLPEHVEGDPDRLRQILVNLLNNAIKFTESGSVRMKVTFSPLVIEVSDTGAGIPPELQPRLFSPFTQGDQSSTRRYQGAGLGLSIVHRLVQLMNGSIEVESEPGKGSLFRVSLPLQPAARAPETKASDSGKRRVIQGLDVLIVEDNPINRRVLTMQLDRLKCRVTSVEDGAQALAVLEESSTVPDVVLMDCQMPRMDGYETTRRIRKLDLGSQPTIIALTAHAMVGEREKCLAAGMDHFLAKPISSGELTRTLSKVPRRPRG